MTTLMVDKVLCFGLLQRRLVPDEWNVLSERESTQSMNERDGEGEWDEIEIEMAKAGLLLMMK
jgi:hypothetical protein